MARTPISNITAEISLITSVSRVLDKITQAGYTRGMATKGTIKFTGPDCNDHYKVVSTKGTLCVRPGEVYSERFITKILLGSRLYDVTFVEFKPRPLDASILRPTGNPDDEKYHERVHERV